MNLSKKIIILLVMALMFFTIINSVSATCNVMVITDPSGNDPNGAAAGSMSFAHNMFQSTFIMSKQGHWAVLSGGEGNGTERNHAIVKALAAMQNNQSIASSANIANSFKGIRLVIGGPTTGAAIAGSFKAYLVTVDDSGTITVTPYTSGVIQLPAGTKGAIIHLRNSEGNPLFGTADRVRKETAINIGKMIRDGYSATYIVGKAMEEVARDSGEKFGGGAVNLVSCVSTDDLFVPAEVNETGYPMDENYSKSCPTCGWAVAYPGAENYDKCPVDGTKLTVSSATDVLINAITVTKDPTSVSIYGTDNSGVITTANEIVKASVAKYGYNSSSIAGSLNKGIHNGLLVGVDYVEPSDLNVKEDSRAVGVYFSQLPNGRTAPTWDLPVNSLLLTILGTIQTVIGFVLVILVLFRTQLLKSFKRSKI